ncbi:MAG: hypothetical protein IK083_01130 [Abditibacteriota bacterium]|nr:hypothetical protein [Abditibacteriota bacterium]
MKSAAVVAVNLLALCAVIKAASLPIPAAAALILTCAFVCGLIQRFWLKRDGVETGLAILTGPLVMYRTKPFLGFCLMLCAGVIFALGMKLLSSKAK